MAVMEKHCPSTPINVPADVWKSREELLGRITIFENQLNINGTDDPDYIVVAPANGSDSVSVTWNGEQLGHFGPISGITLKGNGGDDVLIVKSGLRISASVDGGTGDDCIEGGSGGDQLLGGSGDDVLIAGTGRPALKADSGSDRIVVPKLMGTLRFAPDADSKVLMLLGHLYRIQPLSNGAGNSKETPSPIILGAGDLDKIDFHLVAEAYAAGQAVVITNVTQADAEKLRLLLGHPNATNRLDGSQTGVGVSRQVPLVLFRKALRPGTQAHHYQAGYFDILIDPLGDRMIELISQVFSRTAIVPQPSVVPQNLGDSPSNDLQNLADSYASHVVSQDTSGSGVQIANSVWAVRSFQNQADFYYVSQEADYWQGTKENIQIPVWVGFADNTFSSPITNSALLQPSPASTSCSESTTSGVNWNIGGSAGWNQTQGANATLTGGISVSNSKTISCPSPTTINNQGDPGTGEAKWTFSTFSPGGGKSQLISFFNQWIWEVPLSSYESDQASFQFQSTSEEEFLDGSAALVTASMTDTVPLPLGDTFTLQQPVVSSVSPASVSPGDKFTITGTGMYPSLVTSVLIGGTPLLPTQYTTVSDTQVQVIAPNQSGCHLPVVVQTGEGLSNDSVYINISGNSCQ